MHTNHSFVKIFTFKINVKHYFKLEFRVSKKYQVKHEGLMKGSDGVGKRHISGHDVKY